MKRYTPETTRSPCLRGSWTRWIRRGAVAMVLCAPAAVYAASDQDQFQDRSNDQPNDQANDRPAYVTHSEANPSTSSTARETPEELRTDDNGRLRDVDSAQSNYQPASTDTAPNVSDHPYVQSHFELGAGHVE